MFSYSEASVWNAYFLVARPQSSLISASSECDARSPPTGSIRGIENANPGAQNQEKTRLWQVSADTRTQCESRRGHVRPLCTPCDIIRDQTASLVLALKSTNFSVIAVCCSTCPTNLEKLNLGGQSSGQHRSADRPGSHAVPSAPRAERGTPAGSVSGSVLSARSHSLHARRKPRTSYSSMESTGRGNFLHIKEKNKDLLRIWGRQTDVCTLL